MARNAPGQHHRSGMSLTAFMAKFPNERAAEDWFTNVRWPDGVDCPKCGSDNVYTRPEEKRRNQPYRCRSCKADFSVKTGTLMHSSHIGCLEWVTVMYLMTTNLKGASSMKLHRGLKITRETAQLMARKIRETFEDHAPDPFGGPVEADETCIGGLERNKHERKKAKKGRARSARPRLSA